MFSFFFFNFDISFYVKKKQNVNFSCFSLFFIFYFNFETLASLLTLEFEPKKFQKIKLRIFNNKLTKRRLCTSHVQSQSSIYKNFFPLNFFTKIIFIIKENQKYVHSTTLRFFDDDDLRAINKNCKKFICDIHIFDLLNKINLEKEKTVE